MYYLSSNSVRKIYLNSDPLGSYIDIATTPQEFRDSITPESGVAYHTLSNKLVYWGGKKDIFTFDLTTKEFHKNNNVDIPKKNVYRSKQLSDFDVNVLREDDFFKSIICVLCVRRLKGKDTHLNAKCS